MNDTVFYIVGISLVALALLTSFLGLRYDRFPGSRAIQVAGIAIFAALVVTTATFAWRNAEDEQTKRDAEQASGALPTPAEVDAAEASGESAGQEEQQASSSTTTGATGTSTTGGGTTTTASVDAAKLFDSQGCSSCHTLKAAGATGTVGPDLDTALKGKSTSFIETSIVDPNAEIEKGYPADTMPQNFGQVLSQNEINALVQYLSTSTK